MLAFSCKPAVMQADVANFAVWLISFA